MSKIVTNREDIVAIADAVRNKTNSSEEMTLGDIVNNINNIETGVTPEISISSNGLITAVAGDKSSTHQLAFQPAKTITPSTASQIAVSSGYYTGGDITVAGDANLVAGNIKSGVSIFGVNGTLAGGSGGNTDMEDSLITRNVSSYTNDRVTTIGSYAFYYCTALTTASFPEVTTIRANAFYACKALTTVSFPLATTIGKSAFEYCFDLTTANFPRATTINGYAFYNCTALTTASFPEVTTIGSSAFCSCFNLTTASFPEVTTIGSSAFCKCYNLKSLYLTGSSLCKLSNSNAFSSTPIGGYSTSAGTYGSIYVPASLLTSYQTATNWTYFSSRFVGI
jgi:hypothetical protein